MAKKKHKKKNNTLTIILIVAVVIVGGWLIFRGDGSKKEPVEIISRNGLHWHPQIRIRIHGEEIAIPANIGLFGAHSPIHTHDADNVAHLEFSGIVADRNLQVGEFFRVWGKEFNKECILKNCNGSEGQVSMTVNGEPNLEFDNYVMRDGDRIEIVYE